MISRWLEKSARFFEISCGTAVREIQWRTRHLLKGREWTRGYWESADHAHRGLLIETISSYGPIRSALEIGCNSGPNCRLLAERYPDASIRGIDINGKAVSDGNRWLAGSGMKNVRLETGKAENVSRFPEKSFDVVFTDATLIYVGPDKIGPVAAAMLRAAGKALVLNEWHDERGGSGYSHEGHWVYDYRELFKGRRIRINRLPPGTWGGDWERFGAIIEVSP